MSRLSKMRSSSSADRQRCLTGACRPSSFVPARFGLPDVCAVCLEKDKKSKLVMAQNCEHVLHKTCALKWFAEKRSCPLCRRPADQLISSSGVFEGEAKRRLFEHHRRCGEMFSILEELLAQSVWAFIA